MEQNLSIHHVLKRWSKEMNWPYMGSIIMVNKNVPHFETIYGQTDYGWLLETTRKRKCVEVKPCVVKSVTGNNLSMDPVYRERDYNIVRAFIGNDKSAVKRLNGSRARYFYKSGDPVIARMYFLRSSLTVKNILYYFTSFNKYLRKIIIKKYNVSG